MLQLILLFSIVFYGTIAAESNCECGQRTADLNLFCKSDFVVEVFIKTKLRPQRDGTVIYKIITLQKFKKTKAARMNVLVTPKDCGVHDLLDNGIYIVSGKISDKKMILNQCSSIVREPAKITCNEYNSLREGYAKNCHCQVAMCDKEEECIYKANNCLNLFRDYNCLRSHSTCEINEENKCQWTEISKESEKDEICEDPTLIKFDIMFSKKPGTG